MKVIEKKSDSLIQAEVLSEFQSDARVGLSGIAVEVRSAVVTLTGTVDSLARRHAAQEAAHRVSGVLDVANDIEVRPSGSLERSDTELARVVRDSLERDVRIPHERIRSTVAHGMVTLEGTVDSWSQRVDADEVVRYLTGVRSVDNLISVTPPAVSASAVRRRVSAALARMALGEAQHLEIGVSDGRVALAGTVHSWAERQAVLTAAGATPGVSAVVDYLQVDANP